MMLTPEWLVEALIGATLLMLLVLAVRKPVARLWGAHMAYALWALPALRMVLPALPGWQPLYVPVAQANPGGDVALALMPPADAALYNQPLPPATLQMGPDVSLLPDRPLCCSACGRQGRWPSSPSSGRGTCALWARQCAAGNCSPVRAAWT